MSFLSSRNPSRQASGVAAVVVFHAIIFYVLATGLGRQVVEIIRAPLETRVIDDVKKAPDTPPAPPPKLAPPPPPFIPLPDFRVQTAPAANAITAVTTVKPAEPVVARAPEPPPVAAPVRLSPSINPSKPCAKPEYPSVSKRLEESGVVALLFLVDVDGKAVESKIDKSSGFSRLDNAARDALQQCEFKPGTVDGKPEKAWARINYNWKLE